MIDLTHTLVGAAIGYRINNPYIAFILAIIAHLLLDKLPHYWPDLKNKNSLVRHKFTRALFIIINYIMVAIAIIFFYKYYPDQKVSMIAGALGGAAADFFLVGIPFIYKSRLGRWHVGLQNHSWDKIFILVDIIVVVLALLSLIL